MALIKIAPCLLQNEELFFMIVDFCETIEEIEEDKYSGVKTFRIGGEGIPTEDKQISFNCQRLAEGVRPMIMGIE